ncbi:MgtC/SapB family protein [Lysobacter sp. A3-1-A15]|uniref:MgtC/SapB family protein n=1 Tax=Novilysobacter viscosus TaxID=3098602 RepID=UPI002ED953AD
MEQLAVVGGVAYAMVLGGVIGFERELRDRPAGFRTHMLVAGAAALLVGMERLVLEDHLGLGALLQVDPLRLVEAVVAGVAFIGAGTIFARRGNGAISGITTAATLLMVASIGVSVGFGLHVLAASTTALTLLVLTLLRMLERWMHPDRNGMPRDDSSPREDGCDTDSPGRR